MIDVFAVTRGVLHGHATLRVVGELDLATAPELAAAVDAELNSPLPSASLVVDLTDTAFLDSSGARSIAMASRRARAVGIGLYVLCPPSNARVRGTLSLLKFDDVMPIVDSVRPGIHPAD